MVEISFPCAHHEDVAHTTAIIDFFIRASKNINLHFNNKGKGIVGWEVVVGLATSRVLINCGTTLIYCSSI